MDTLYIIKFSFEMFFITHSQFTSVLRGFTQISLFCSGWFSCMSNRNNLCSTWFSFIFGAIIDKTPSDNLDSILAISTFLGRNVWRCQHVHLVFFLFSLDSNSIFSCDFDGICSGLKCWTFKLAWNLSYPCCRLAQIQFWILKGAGGAPVPDIFCRTYCKISWDC